MQQIISIVLDVFLNILATGDQLTALVCLFAIRILIIGMALDSSINAKWSFKLDITSSCCLDIRNK